MSLEHNDLLAQRKPAVSAWLSTHRLKLKAYAKVERAKKAGLLPKLSEGKTACIDCGGIAREYDHRDYAQPLVVEPVCRRCNALRGPALQRVQAVAEYKARKAAQRALWRKAARA